MYSIQTFKVLGMIIELGNFIGTIPVKVNYRRQLFRFNKNYNLKSQLCFLFDLTVLAHLWVVGYLDYLFPNVIAEQLAKACMYFGIIFYPAMLLFDFVLCFRAEIVLAGANMSFKFLKRFQDEFLKTEMTQKDGCSKELKGMLLFQLAIISCYLPSSCLCYNLVYNYVYQFAVLILPLAEFIPSFLYNFYVCILFIGHAVVAVAAISRLAFFDAAAIIVVYYSKQYLKCILEDHGLVGLESSMKLYRCYQILVGMMEKTFSGLIMILGIIILGAEICCLYVALLKEATLYARALGILFFVIMNSVSYLIIMGCAHIRDRSLEIKQSWYSRIPGNSQGQLNKPLFNYVHKYNKSCQPIRLELTRNMPLGQQLVLDKNQFEVEQVVEFLVASG